MSQFLKTNYAEESFEAALRLYKTADSLKHRVSDKRNVSYLNGLLLNYNNEVAINLKKQLKSNEKVFDQYEEKEWPILVCF